MQLFSVFKRVESDIGTCLVFCFPYLAADIAQVDLLCIRKISIPVTPKPFLLLPPSPTRFFPFLSPCCPSSTISTTLFHFHPLWLFVFSVPLPHSALHLCPISAFPPCNVITKQIAQKPHAVAVPCSLYTQILATIYYIGLIPICLKSSRDYSQLRIQHSTHIHLNYGNLGILPICHSFFF